MSQPQNRTEFLIRFIFGMLFFGLVVALIGLRFVATLDLRVIAVWVLITTALSVLIALRGDGEWHRLANFFKWS